MMEDDWEDCVNEENKEITTNKRPCFNLRKSLAWNQAFFTEQGVLNQQELSRLGKFSDELLSDIPEEPVKSDGSGLHHPEIKLLHNSPLRNPKLSARPLSNNVDSAPEALATKTSYKLDLVKNVNKKLSEAGSCPRPSGLASKKRLPISNLRNVPRKDLKIPKHSFSNLEQSSASANLTAFEAKRSSYNCNRPEGVLRKYSLPKGSTNTSKTTFSCIASNTKTSAHYLGKDMATIAATGSNVIPYPVPTVDTKTGKVLPQNAHYSYGKFHNALIHAERPSGLRMPSPSLRYFAQPHVSSSSNVKSPRNNQSSKLHEVSIPIMRKYGDTRDNGDMKPSFEPILTMKMPEGCINGMNSFMPTAVSTVSHSSFRSKKEFNRSVMENLQVSHLPNSEMGINSDGKMDNSTGHEHAEKAHGDSKSNILVGTNYRKGVSSELTQSEDPQQPIPHEVERVHCRANHKNNARWVEQTTSEESIKDLDIKNSRGNEFNNIPSKGTEITGLSHSRNISDYELKCEFQTGLHSGSSKKLQKYAYIEDFINVHPENEKYKAGELKISQVPPLNSEMQSYSLSGVDYLVEHKIGEIIQESSKSSTTVNDIENCATMVQNNCLEVGNHVKTLLGEQQALEKFIVAQVDDVQHEENHSPLNSICGLIGQDNSSEIFLEDNDPVNLGCKEAKDAISLNHSETSDLHHSRISDGAKNCELESTELPTEDILATIIPLFESKISALEESLAHLELKQENMDLTQDEQRSKGEVLRDLEQWYTTEARFWQRKSGQKWNAEGDRCTRFYHNIANYNFKSSNIAIMEVNSALTRDPVKIEDHIVRFFEDLYKEPTKQRPKAAIQFEQITTDENTELERTFEEGEVAQAIKSLAQEKTPANKNQPMTQEETFSH